MASEQATEARAVEPGRAGGGRVVAAMGGEDRLEVAALERGRPAIAGLVERAVRLARDRRADADGERALDERGELRHVLGPGPTRQLREELAGAQALGLRAAGGPQAVEDVVDEGGEVLRALAHRGQPALDGRHALVQ